MEGYTDDLIEITNYRDLNDSFDFHKDPTKRDDNSSLSSEHSSDFNLDTVKKANELEKAYEMSMDVGAWLLEHDQDSEFADEQTEEDREAMARHLRFDMYPKFWANKRKKHNVKKNTVDLTGDDDDDKDKEMPDEDKKMPAKTPRTTSTDTNGKKHKKHTKNT